MLLVSLDDLLHLSLSSRPLPRERSLRGIASTVQGYKVFREVLLRCVTERKKCPIDKLVHSLLNAEDVMSAARRAQGAVGAGEDV